MDPEPQPTTPSEASLIRAFLANRDEPCPGCNYNLRGLIGDQCPECSFRPRLCLERRQMVIPRETPWISAAAIGIFFIIAVWQMGTYLFGSFPSGLPRGFMTRLFLMNLAYCVAPLIGLLIARKWCLVKGQSSSGVMIVLAAVTVWCAQLIYQLVDTVGYLLGLW